MADKFKFKRPTLHVVLMVVFSLFCSLLLWVFVTSTEGDEKTLSFSGVKVVFEGESTLRDTKDLIITSLNTTSVRVTVTGNRRVVYKLTAADITAVIDLTNISNTGNYTLSPKITFPSDFDKSSVSVSTSSPSLINFYIDKISTKTVPVQGKFNGSPAEGFSVEPLSFSPETVKITGPENALAEVDHAWVEVDRDNVDKTLSFDSTYVLMNADGEIIDNDAIELVTDTVTVTLPVTAIKEVDLTLTIIPGGGATDANVKYTVEPSSITLSGDSEILNGINSISLDTIDLSEVKDPITKTYTIVIPNDTKIVSGTKEALVTLEVKGLETKSVTIPSSNFSCINVSDGYNAKIIDEKLNVVIRGTKSVLNDISSNNIRAVADLADFGTASGIFYVPVKIYVDGTTAAGAVGVYKVYVNVQMGR